MLVGALKPALGMAWKYALKIAPSLCLLKEKVTNITFPEDVSFMTGDEPETGSPHHLTIEKNSQGNHYIDNELRILKKFSSNKSIE